MEELPEGFTLDETPAPAGFTDLPEGFVLDSEPSSPSPAPVEPAKPEPKLKLPAYNRPVEAIRAALRGGTLGVSDVVGSGIAAGAAALTTPATFGEAYKDIKSDIGEQRDAYREDRPLESAGMELAGGIAPAILTGGTAMAAPATTMGKAALGAGLGAAQGGIYGATQADVGKELQGAKTGAAIGGAVGGALPVVAGAAGRVISPKASTNPELLRLKEMGVQPTIGQTLGGIANDVEQKLTSVPFAGKKIAEQRFSAREQYNEGILNEVLKPIGATTKGAGFDAIKDAGDKVSKYYDDQLAKIDHVKFDDEFFANVEQLKQMASGMNEQSARQFNRILQNSIGPRMSEAGAMLPETYKRVQSELTAAASEVSDKQLSTALKQAGQLLKDQMYRSNPEVAVGLKNADTAFAMLVRAEDAAKRAVNSDGVFTPAQLNAAIKSADKSSRKRAVARGDALLQEDARIGQSILANTEPDSGTMGRLAMGSSLLSGGGVAGLMAGTASAPALAATGAGIGALRAMYSQPVQNALVNAVSKRGALAPEVAKQLGVATNYLIAPSSVGAARLANE